jgi:hypothetical protein
MTGDTVMMPPALVQNLGVRAGQVTHVSIHAHRWATPYRERLGTAMVTRFGGNSHGANGADGGSCV